jgi:tetratricopeptide (TPR) repeat protein
LILNAMFPEHDGPQPLAAHFNRHGDGARLALLKLVAALAGVRLDELAQRDAQRRSHDATRLGVAALAGMAIMAGLAVVAIKARGNAERERARGEKLIGFLLTNLRTELKGVGRLDLLDKVNTGVNDYFRAQDLSQMMDGALQQRAQLLQAAGEDDMARGKYEQARQQLVEGERTTAALLQAAPNDQERIFAHSQSEFWVGYVSWRLKEFATARAHFEAYLAHTQRLVQMDPNNPRWQREIGDANLNLGMFVCRRFLDLTRARSYFDASLDEFTVAAQSLPGDSDVLFGLVDSHAGLSDLELMQQHYERASAEREKVAQLLADWLKHDPTNAETRTRQAYNNLGFARIDIAQGATTKAIEQLQEGRAVAEQLAREDPENADARRQLRILALFEARAWMALPISVRPGDAQIDADIGDCDADGTKLDSHELATFCSILRAGYTGLSGHADAAHNQLSALRGETAISRGTLSERWGLDFDEEIAAMTAVINSRSK